MHIIAAIIICLGLSAFGDKLVARYDCGVLHIDRACSDIQTHYREEAEEEDARHKRTVRP